MGPVIKATYLGTGAIKGSDGTQPINSTWGFTTLKRKVWNTNTMNEIAGISTFGTMSSIGVISALSISIANSMIT